MAARGSKRDRIIDAAMELAGEARWSTLTLTAIAGRARVSLAELRAEFTGRRAILAAFLARIDREMLAEPENGGGDDAVRDRLFDLVMRRLDALGPYKPALRNILADLGARPPAALAGLGRVMRTQRWVLDAAGAAAPGPRGRLKTCGLTAIYLNTLAVWLGEDDPGLPRTMARLDRLLRRGERALERADGPITLAETFAAVVRETMRRRRERRPSPPPAGADGVGEGEGGLP